MANNMKRPNIYMFSLVLYFIISSIFIILFGVYKYCKNYNKFYFELIIVYYISLLISLFFIRKYIKFFSKFTDVKKEIILCLGFITLILLIVLYIILNGNLSITGIKHSDILLFILSGIASAYFMFYFYLCFLNNKKISKNKL